MIGTCLKWAAGIGAAWFILAAVVAVTVGRSIRLGDQRRPVPTPDFLWTQPTDSLSDAAVDMRFHEIVAPLERDERRRQIEARREILRNQRRGAA